MTIICTVSTKPIVLTKHLKITVSGLAEFLSNMPIFPIYQVKGKLVIMVFWRYPCLLQNFQKSAFCI